MLNEVQMDIFENAIVFCGLFNWFQAHRKFQISMIYFRADINRTISKEIRCFIWIRNFFKLQQIQNYLLCNQILWLL